MVSQLKLTRDQLSGFLPDQESIKQFEKLFETTNELSTSTTDYLYISAEGAASSAAEALSQIESIKREIGILLVEAKKEFTLATLPDISIYNPDDNSLLQYDIADGKWKAQSPNDIIVITTSQQLTDVYHTAIVTVSGLTVTLPQASSTNIGNKWTILLNVVGMVTISVDAGDNFILPVSSTTIELYNKGDSLTFKIIDSSTWGIV